MLESKEIRKIVVDAHMEFQKSFGTTIKMSFPEGASLAAGYCAAETWEIYFDSLARTLAARVQDYVHGECVVARTRGIEYGRADVLTRGDGVPYTPPEAS